MEAMSGWHRVHCLRSRPVFDTGLPPKRTAQSWSRLSTLSRFQLSELTESTAPDTLGRQIVDGHPEVRILGNLYPVKARIIQMPQFSAHADRLDLLRWAGGIRNRPERVFVTHGEQPGREGLARALAGRYHWTATLPRYLESLELF